MPLSSKNKQNVKTLMLLVIIVAKLKHIMIIRLKNGAKGRAIPHRTASILIFHSYKLIRKKTAT